MRVRVPCTLCLIDFIKFRRPTADSSKWIPYFFIFIRLKVIRKPRPRRQEVIILIIIIRTPTCYLPYIFTVITLLILPRSVSCSMKIL